jgi:hypothetical protein
MKNESQLEKLKALSKHMHYYNIMAPFPVYDTDHVKAIDIKIKNMENTKTKEYDSEPVVACKHCKSLHIITDDNDNNICMKCGSVNELQTFTDIHEYNLSIDKKDSL